MISCGHYIEKCACGVVLKQCRCPGPKPSVESREPCTHVTPSYREQRLAEIAAHYLDWKNVGSVQGWTSDVGFLLDEVRRLQAEVRSLYQPPADSELSAYAFCAYGNDARLYNGIRDLERKVERMLRADVEGR